MDNGITQVATFVHGGIDKSRQAVRICQIKVAHAF